METRYARAIELQQKLSDIHADLGQNNIPFLHKSQLSLVILHLANGDEVAAGKVFTRGCNENGFLNSEEGKIAQDILAAYDERDQKQVQDALTKSGVRKSILGFLDNEITKLAYALRVPGEGVAPKREVVEADGQPQQEGVLTSVAEGALTGGLEEGSLM